MNHPDLAYRATLAEACTWLQEQTGNAWRLASLIEYGITPYVWLDYNDQFPELFGDANGGYAAPIFFQGDTQRLAAGSADVLITMTKDADKIAIQLPSPGIRAPLDDLRFLRKDLNRLLEQIKKDALPAKEQKPIIVESNKGIIKEQAILAFASLVKINFEVALMNGEAIFGDEGARIKSSAKAAKNKWLWNPVTLALGLNDNYRVPMSRLKRVFMEHEFLMPWMAQWQDTLALLGE
ncbi:hypothetical protein [Undibacterium sp. Di24W]|uniref:hypothetical protein n=1 Tax=Undibacterium sp. Di24W TaxID=3413033 RepID=UPI003BF3233B